MKYNVASLFYDPIAKIIYISYNFFCTNRLHNVDCSYFSTRLSNVYKSIIENTFVSPIILDNTSDRIKKNGFRYDFTD